MSINNEAFRPFFRRVVHPMVHRQNVNFKNLTPETESNLRAHRLYEFSIISAVSRVIYSRQFHNKHLNTAPTAYNYT